MIRSRDDEGQALVEYAIILLLVALVTISALSVLGSTVESMFEAVVAAF